MTMENFRTLSWADFFLYALTDPRELYRRIHSGNGKVFGLSFIVPAMVCIADILALSLMGSETSYFYYKISYGWILVCLYEFFKIVIYSSMIDSVSQFQGFKGNIKEVITMVNFSMVPKIFILPLVYFFSLLDFAPAFFYVFAAFLLFIWYVFVLVQGLSEMNSANFGKSMAIYILPAFFLGVILFFIVILLLMMGAGLIM